MRTIKTYSKRAPFYNALTRHLATSLRTKQLVSLSVAAIHYPLAMSDPLSIPDEKKASDPSARDRALNNLALAFFAGWSAGMGAHWLGKSRSTLGLLYFVSTLVFLGIAIRRVYSMFARTGTNRDSTSV